MLQPQLHRSEDDRAVCVHKGRGSLATDVGGGVAREADEVRHRLWADEALADDFTANASPSCHS
jgi:hypothetical protein